MYLALRWVHSACLAFCIFCFATTVSAQNDGNVSVSSDPQGALVSLRGEVSLSGVTPVRFDRSLSGRYEIEVAREGYERHRSAVYFSETKTTEISVKLTPKTRIKALFRSAIIPGWGQRYYGSQAKSTLFFVGAVASGIGYAMAKNDCDNKLDTYRARVAARAAITQWSEIPRLNAQVQEAQKKANDAENTLNIVTIAAAGIYALNLLDAFAFFPDFNSYAEYKALTVVPSVDGRGAAVRLALRF